MRRLRNFILTGRLKEGQTLPAERDLAGKLKVSRGTLRQAIAALTSQGLLRAKHGSGTTVRSWLSDGAFDLLTPLLLSRHDDRLVEQLLWLRRTLHTSLAELWTEPRRDFGPALMAGLEVSEAAHKYDGTQVRRILDSEERLLCLFAAEVNLPAGMLAHAIRRALGQLFATAEQPVVLSNEHPLFNAAVKAFMAGRRSVRLVDELCSLREATYLDAALRARG
jgi:DNA-binding transcriptional MocR family regulator